MLARRAFPTSPFFFSLLRHEPQSLGKRTLFKRMGDIETVAQGPQSLSVFRPLNSGELIYGDMRFAQKEEIAVLR